MGLNIKDKREVSPFTLLRGDRVKSETILMIRISHQLPVAEKLGERLDLNFDPNQVYKWFMELFIDSYEWVMVPNIYGMSQYSDGGLMSTKPYISGSNYILKMSNYSKGEWTQIWDSLYWNFINKNRNYFLSNPRMSMMVSIYDKKKLENKLAYNKIIKSIKF